MLGIKNYGREYIDACRARVDADLEAYRRVAGATTDSTALAAFEASYFNNMVLLLDTLFVHRLRTVEGKDGNPMNEVRVLCDSMLNNGNMMRPEKTIKLVPAKTVLKHDFGDEIKLSEADFVKLSDAYFAEIESKFL
jgi:hypothetical protein